MNSEGLKSVVKDFRGEIFEKKTLHGYGHSEIDSASALQSFLNRIPVESIPSIRTTQVVEIKSDMCVRDAIKMLHEKNVFGAPIVDELDFHMKKFWNPYIGFANFAGMVLWSLEEFTKAKTDIKKENCEEINTVGFFSMLDKIPCIGHIKEFTEAKTDIKKENYEGINTVGYFSMLDKIPCTGHIKVGGLANLYIWDPFFPVHLDDTLFHVQLLLSKHRLQVVPVIERSSSHVIGFVTQAAVIEMLLQSSGLEWFDGIADRALLDFRFGSDGCPFCIYGDQSIAEAFHSLWENKKDQIAVLNRETTKLVGVVRIDDLRNLLDDDEVFHNRISLKVEEFIDADARGSNSSLDTILDKHLGAKSKFRLTSPVTNREKDTLKHVMELLVETQSNCSFLVDDSGHVKGEVTMKDIIMQFSPPMMDSRIDGGGFFQSALEQTGCSRERKCLS